MGKEEIERDYSVPQQFGISRLIRIHKELLGKQGASKDEILYNEKAFLTSLIKKSVNAHKLNYMFLGIGSKEERYKGKVITVKYRSKFNDGVMRALRSLLLDGLDVGKQLDFPLPMLEADVLPGEGILVNWHKDFSAADPLTRLSFEEKVNYESVVDWVSIPMKLWLRSEYDFYIEEGKDFIPENMVLVVSRGWDDVSIKFAQDYVEEDEEIPDDTGYINLKGYSFFVPEEFEKKYRWKIIVLEK